MWVSRVLQVFTFCYSLRWCIADLFQAGKARSCRLALINSDGTVNACEACSNSCE